MSTITRERLQRLIRAIDSENYDEDEIVGWVNSDEILELARIALASLEAEPAIHRWRRVTFEPYGPYPWHYGNFIGFSKPVDGIEDEYYYAAPPAPVSVPAAMEMDDDFDSAFEHGKAVGWNACRAAMLQGADGRPELTVWYGSMPESNGKTNWTAILHRKGEGIQDGMTIDRSEYPGRVLYAADYVRYLIGEKADRPYILDYDADTHSGYVEPVSQRYKLPEEKGASLQLRTLIRKRHAEWSDSTFGNVGPVGPLKHLSKEALEASAEPDDLSEWADMQFLLWDAQRRAGISDGEITAAMEEKLKVNMARQWPEPKDGEPRLHIKAAPQQEVK